MKTNIRNYKKCTLWNNLSNIWGRLKKSSKQKQIFHHQYLLIFLPLQFGKEQCRMLFALEMKLLGFYPRCVSLYDHAIREYLHVLIFPLKKIDCVRWIAGWKCCPPAQKSTVIHSVFFLNKFLVNHPKYVSGIYS